MGDDKKNNRIRKNKKFNSGGYRLYRTQGSGRNWGWRIFFTFILIWIVAAYFFRQAGSNVTELSYTKFKQTTGDNKVKEITILGNSISGEFKSPYKKIVGGDR